MILIYGNKGEKFTRINAQKTVIKQCFSEEIDKQVRNQADIRTGTVTNWAKA